MTARKSGALRAWSPAQTNRCFSSAEWYFRAALDLAGCGAAVATNRITTVSELRNLQIDVRLKLDRIM
jgi:hypothetical protein